MSTSSNGSGQPQEKELPAEKIGEHFQKLREEQQVIASRMTQVDADRSEHKVVADTLAGVEPGRKCYRLIGGVLVERTVAEVLPALRDNEKKLAALLEQYNENLIKKGKELNEFKEKHNIRFVTEAERDQLRKEQEK